MCMLDGIRILDLSRLLPGPFCSWLLASHGAEVVKVEDPKGGDYLRWIPPFEGGLGALFTAINRGKRSVALDLRRPAGQGALERLLPHFDVLLESFRPGVMARLGLAPQELLERNPGLVVASLTGFGQDGPWSHRPGHDLNFQALAGLLAPAARPGGVPCLPAIPVADMAGGALTAAFTITAALLQRARTGAGAWLDLSMTEGSLALIAPFLATSRAVHPPPPPGGDLLTGGHPPYGIYRCGDGKLITLAALEPQFWQRVRERLALASPVPDRAELAAALATQPRDHWVQRLEGTCTAPLLELEELMDHALHRSRGVFRSVGSSLTVRPPMGRFLLDAPPRLGEHSQQELEAAGVDFAALATADVSCQPAGSGE